MSLIFLFWLFNSIQVNCCIIPEQYNDMGNSLPYKVSEGLDEEYSELMHKDRFQSLKVEEQEKELYEMIRLANKENNKVKKPIYWFKFQDITVMETTPMNLITSIIKSTTPTPKKSSSTMRRGAKKLVSTINVYQFIQEYFDGYSVNVTNYIKTEVNNILETGGSFNHRAGNNSKGAKKLGVRAMKNLVADLRNQNYFTTDFANRVWRVVKILLLVYLAIAVPFWSTKGWCCCWLCCKFFKPQRTIEEAKTYYVQNPPGILKEKKDCILYEPSDKEREYYLEFGHIIKIV